MKALLFILFLGTLYGNTTNSHEQKGSGTILSPVAEEVCTPTPTELPIYEGRVSFYDNSYCQKHNPSCKTASGEVFNEDALTCACSDLYPLGVYLRFSYGNNSVVCRCSDRGSFEDKYNRLADLSKACFQELAPLEKGVIKVKIKEEK